MSSTKIIFERNDLDIDRTKKISQKSAAKVQKWRDEQFQEAIRDGNTAYIDLVMRNVSTLELIKMLIKKIATRFEIPSVK